MSDVNTNSCDTNVTLGAKMTLMDLVKLCHQNIFKYFIFFEYFFKHLLYTFLNIFIYTKMIYKSLKGYMHIPTWPSFDSKNWKKLQTTKTTEFWPKKAILPQKIKLNSDKKYEFCINKLNFCHEKDYMLFLKQLRIYSQNVIICHFL